MALFRFVKETGLPWMVKKLLPPRYWVSRARRAARAGNWALAAQFYERSLGGASPELAQVWVQYGHALKEQGNLWSAGSAYTVAVQLAPTADTLVHLGHVLLRHSRSAEAAEAFFRALTLDPNSALARKGLAATGTGPDTLTPGLAAETLVHLGHVLLRRSRYEEAAQAFFRALALDPDFAPAREGLIAAGIAPDAIPAALERATAARDDVAPVSTLLGARHSRVSVPRVAKVALTPVTGGVTLKTAVAERIAQSSGTYPNHCTVAVDQQRLVGWAFLPLDFHHTPIVNVYHRGGLVACALANRTRPSELTSGPRYNWFEVLWRNWGWKPDANQLEQLVLQRGEDGQIWSSGLDETRSGMLTVDALVEAELFDEPLLKPSVAVCRTLPAKALVELYYLDYLGRAADPEAATSYGSALESNAIGIDDLRNQLLHSEEFRRRDIRPHHRLGRGTMISALSVYERAPFGKHAPLKRYEHLSAVEFAASDNSRFLEACYAKIIRRKPDRRTHQTLLGALEEARMSRLDVMRELVLQAAAEGRYVEIDDLPSAQAATATAQSRISPEGALL